LDAWIAYYTCKQGQYQSNAEYLEKLSANVQVLEYYKASAGYTLFDPSRGNVYASTQIARGYTIAMAFLRGAYPRRYATL
jgi:hypothetical protein